VRIEVGPRDLEQGVVSMSRRDRGVKEKESITPDALVAGAVKLLEEIQSGMLAKAKAFRDANTKIIDDPKEFREFFTPKTAESENLPTEIHGGFASCRFAMDADAEAKLKNELGVTVRVVPMDNEKDPGPCILTGKPAERRVLFAKSY
jgi:prolyl-tRNA synthetase